MDKWGWNHCQNESADSSILRGRYWQTLNAEVSKQLEKRVMRIKRDVYRAV